MTGRTRLLTTSVGAKVAMAITGLCLVVFLLFHVAGNLLVFGGRNAFNGYAETLQGLGPLLWIGRAGLLVLFVAHVAVGIRLVRKNRAARPQPYAHEATVAASHASRTMIQTGLIVLVFVIVHLLHFTVGAIRPADFALTEDVVRNGVTVPRHDAFGMVLGGFHDDRIVALYVIGLWLIGLHLSHGVSSLFQSLGLRRTSTARWIERGGRTLAWALAAAFIAIVLGVRVGVAG